jgi:hypothetical protein
MPVWVTLYIASPEPQCSDSIILRLRNINLLPSFKRKRYLIDQVSQHSPAFALKSDYHFALTRIIPILAGFILLFAACSLNHTLTVPVNQQVAPPTIFTETAGRQLDYSITDIPEVHKLPGNLSSPTLPSQFAPVSILTVAPPKVLPTSQPIGTLATNTPGVLVTSDLLFLSENRLLRWDRVTQCSSSLAENVTAFSSNSNGSKIALLRQRGVAANGNELFDLDMLDFSSKQVSHLLEGIPQVLHLAISPDGAWLAFQQMQDDHPALFLLSIINPVTPLKLGQCEVLPSGGCTRFSWSADSQSLLWGDLRGLWVVPLRTSIASLIHNDKIDVTDPQGNTSQIEVQFSNPQWSPSSRFILTQITPNQSDASWYAIVDSLTGRIGHVLDSYQLSSGQVSINWLPNGQLVVARSSDRTMGSPAAIQIWDVLATNPSLLVSSVLYRFPSGVLATGSAAVSISSVDIIPLELGWVQQSNPGHLLFGAAQPETGSSVRFFDLNLITNSINQVVQFNTDVNHVLWALDGSGFLVATAGGKMYFVPSNGGSTIDLKLTAGSNPQGILWLPPSLRK